MWGWPGLPAASSIALLRAFVLSPSDRALKRSSRDRPAPPYEPKHPRRSKDPGRACGALARETGYRAERTEHRLTVTVARGRRLRFLDAGCPVWSFDIMDDNPQFQHRAIDRRTTAFCPDCQRDVALPVTEPWLLVEGVATPPQLQSFLCPSCRARIYLRPVSDDERLRDTDLDELEDAG